MPSLRPIPAVPCAPSVGRLSAQSGRPSPRSAMSASRRLRPSAARDRKIRQPPEGRKFPQEPAGNQDSEPCTSFDKYPRRAANNFNVGHSRQPQRFRQATMRAHGRPQGLKRTTRRTGFLDVNQKFKSAPGREIASPTPAVRIALKWQPLPEGTPILTTTGLGSNSIQVDRFRGRMDIPNRGSSGARRAGGRGHSDLGDKGSA